MCKRRQVSDSSVFFVSNCGCNKVLDGNDGRISSQLFNARIAEMCYTFLSPCLEQGGLFFLCALQAVRNVTWSVENLRQFVDKNVGKELEGKYGTCTFT